MKILYSFLSCAVILFFSETLFSQKATGSDSTRISKMIEDAGKLTRNTKHDESIQLLEKVKTEASDLGLTRHFYEAEIEIAQNLWRMYQFEEANIKISSVLQALPGKFDRSDPIFPKALLNEATILMMGGDFDEAIKKFNGLIALCETLDEKSWDTLSAAYANLGYLYTHLGKYDKQYEVLMKAYDLDRRIYDRDHVYIADDLGNLATSLIRMKNHKNALGKLQDALNMYERLDEKSGGYTNALYTMGQCYEELGLYHQSLDLLKQALKNNVRLYGTDHIDNGDLFEAIGLNLLRQNQLDSSLSYFRHSLRFEKQAMELGYSNIIYRKSGYARALSQKGNLKGAFLQLHEALDFINQSSQSDHFLAHIYNEFGAIYMNIEEYETATEYLQRSIDHIEKDSVENPGVLAEAYRNIANSYAKRENYNLALTAIQKSFDVNRNVREVTLPLSNPNTAGVVNHETFLKCLIDKALILDNILANNNYSSKDTLIVACQTHEMMDQWIHSKTSLAASRGDASNFLESLFETYSAAMTANYKMFELTSDEKYKFACLRYSESYKAGILKKSQKSFELSHSAGISNNLLSVETDLNDDISFFNSQKNKLDTSASSYQDKVAYYDSILFARNKRLDSIRVMIKENYGQFRYDDYVLTTEILGKIQSNLETQSGIVEYFLGKEWAYCFYIDSEGLEIFDLGPSSEVLDKANKTIQLIRSNESSASEFALASQALYETIFLPFASTIQSQVSNLIIVPDGLLNYVPFDLLLASEPTSSNINFKNLPYLMNRYSIWNISSMSFEQSRKDPDLGSKNQLIAFAPDYKDIMQNGLINPVPNGLRNGLAPLKWNSEEVELISNFMTSSLHLGDSATEDAFKTNAPGFDVIHLAMHALVDEEEPSRSQLIFSSHSDSTEDGQLHFYELLNMRLNVEMVTLSACETGIGRFVRGDGVASLANAFAYAGAQSVVMSQWKVDDQSTSELMSHFYRGLSEGKNKGVALSAAKKEYLKNCSPNKSHPFYWGAFVLLGNDAPIISESKLLEWVLVLGAVLMVATYFIRKSV